MCLKTAEIASGDYNCVMSLHPIPISLHFSCDTGAQHFEPCIRSRAANNERPGPACKDSKPLSAQLDGRSHRRTGVSKPAHRLLMCVDHDELDLLRLSTGRDVERRQERVLPLRTQRDLRAGASAELSGVRLTGECKPAFATVSTAEDCNAVAVAS